MLTRKQLDLLDFIHRRIEATGVPPSFDEMREALDLRSKSGVHRLITALEERGFIRRLPHRARALEIVRLPDALRRHSGAGIARAGGFQPRIIEGDREADQPGTESGPGEPPAAREEGSVAELPLLGRIAAGMPIEAIEDRSATVAVPRQMTGGRGDHYALEVKGDSMIEAGINDGDIVVVREARTADNGDIVVALIDNAEATLKKFHRRGKMIALEAANPAYETRILPQDRVKIQGRLVGLIRTY